MNEWPPLPPNRDDLKGEELGYYDEVADRQRRLWGMEPTGYFGAMLNSPRLAAAVSELGRRVRTSATEGVTSDAVREMRLEKGQVAAALIKSTEVMILRM